MREKLNNKGMSLVELLIAIAIAAVVSTLIVTMMASGTNLFRAESEKIDRQSDMQIVQNQVADILRQAKSITVIDGADGVVIYTGSMNAITKKLDVEETSETNYTDCIITYDATKDTLYVTSKYMSTIPDGYILSNNVTEFDIEFATSATTNTLSDGTTESYYKNPISVDVKIDIGSGEDKKDADMTVRLRNKVEKYQIYEIASIYDSLTSASALKIYDIR